MSVLIFIVRYFMYFFIPLLVTALGGMFSERSGVMNMALDSIMVFSAMWGVFFMNAMKGTIPGQWLLIASLLVSALTGILFAMLLAYSAISLKANQTIAAMALNTFAPAFCVFYARLMNSGNEIIPFPGSSFRIAEVPLLSKIPVIGPMFFQQAYLTTYIGIALFIIGSIIIDKTRYGLRMCACGENPQAAASLGVNVYRTRYIAVAISGALAGMGGLMYIVPISASYSCTVAGYGYLALAVLIFGRWRSKPLLLAAVFFSLCKTLASAYTSIPFLAALPFPDAFYKSFPFMLTLIALAFTSKNSSAPKANGQPYDQGKR
ncbi:MAG: ABC transporter permease [Erysipelotrichales bacterium]|nr:ABC transporter permease [Erysipelotrichales bacterium]